MPKTGRDGMVKETRTLVRISGWGTLIVAVAGTVAVVSPLVMPDTDMPPPIAQPSSSTAIAPPYLPPTPPAVVSSDDPQVPVVQIHAADPANILRGARVIECKTCEGGLRVGYIGGPNILAIAVSGVTSAGIRTLTITYETEEPRTLKISVSGGHVQELPLAGAGSWLIPAEVSVPVFIPAGTSWIKFFNDNGAAPDINKIVVR